MSASVCHDQCKASETGYQLFYALRTSASSTRRLSGATFRSSLRRSCLRVSVSATTTRRGGCALGRSHHAIHDARSSQTLLLLYAYFLGLVPSREVLKILNQVLLFVLYSLLLRELLYLVLIYLTSLLVIVNHDITHSPHILTYKLYPLHPHNNLPPHNLIPIPHTHDNTPPHILHLVHNIHCSHNVLHINQSISSSHLPHSRLLSLSPRPSL